MTDDARLLHEEEQLELHALDEGINRYRLARIDREEASLPPGRDMIADNLEPVVDALEKAVNDVVIRGYAAQGAAYWAVPLFAYPVNKSALLTLAVLLNHADTISVNSLANITATLGTRWKTEYDYYLLSQEAPKLKAVMQRKLKRWTPRRVAHAVRKAEALHSYMPMQQRRWIGWKLMSLAVENTDLFEIQARPQKAGWMNALRLTEAARQRLETHHRDQEILRPCHLPMVVRPAPWGPAKPGGYIYHEHPFTRPLNRLDRPPAERLHGPNVYRAVNYLQSTAWQVDPEILEIAQAVWAAGGGFAKLPAATPQELPERTPDLKYDPDAQRKWRTEAASVHRSNVKIVSRRHEVLRALLAAKRMAKYERIFFPHNTCFRGRMYPVNDVFHPQGSDLVRGLLRFAAGRPVTERAKFWLKAQLAGCCDQDKVSWAERIAWVDDRMDLILATADDPLEHKWWADQDKPWQALSAIREIARVERDPHTLTHLRCGIDGANSGLQHFAALLRDEEGGRLVNLVPGDRPADMYQAVADRVIGRLEADYHEIASCGDPTHHPVYDWRGSVTRKTVKRAGMTFCYGVTRQGMADALIEDGFTEGHHDPRSSSAYLRDLTWETLPALVPSAATAMDWLREVASVASRLDQDVRWVTPSGFQVVQDYLMERESTITTLHHRITYHQADETLGLSTYKQRNGLPPNFIHSLDASHMALVLNELETQGVPAVAMVHDEFGSHATDMDTLARVVPEKFVEMYRTDWLTHYHQRWQSDLGVEFPQPPAPGGLDLEAVCHSRYAFA